MRILQSFLMLLFAVACANAGNDGAWRQPQFVTFEKTDGFTIVADGRVAPLCVDAKDWTGVSLATASLADDVERVTGRRPEVTNKPQPGSVIIGTVGRSRIIDKLISQKKIDLRCLKGQWESYVIETVDNQLVIAGSDRRGTVYGIYELSRQMGVSPWYWWADVPAMQHSEVYVATGRHLQPSPKVKYRGIFINDEDWGLKPWAAKTYEKELGDIGPRTYARVCELLLRLKANMLAPAMHSCTGAFYSHPESKAVCDSFGVIITTSHCEPLLLNNAAKSEWNQQLDGDWNYKTNEATIRKKWDDRLAEAAHYENIYTVAMRGLHDSGLRGNLPMEERVPLISRVIDDQRHLLVKHKAYTPTVSSKTTALKPQDIPQIFVPYKETMDIYEAGLQVPDDITLVWVDDNYGYMKRVSNPQEQARKGGSGVYYHLSYLGAPHDYLWINTTPPVLMYEELMKAYLTGADRYWLLNVGDIKPMELGIQTFMEMAWNPETFSFRTANSHQAAFLAETFGMGTDVATLQSLLNDYYRLAWSRKPEFMGFEYEWDDKEHTGLKPTGFSFRNYGEAQQRLADYQRISDMVERLAPAGTAREAFFEMVQFPVQAACQMNRKFLMAQLNSELAAEGRTAEANWAARQMEQAFDSINALNRRYNEQLGGKWRHMMAIPPGYCALYHKKPAVVVTEGAGEKHPNLAVSSWDDTTSEGCYVVNLADYESKSADAQVIGGLGYDWRVMRLGTATYRLPHIDSDSITLVLYTVPFWPIFAGKSNAVRVSIDGGQPKVFDNVFREYDRTWKDQVIRNGASCRLPFTIDRSLPFHTLTFEAAEPGQMVQRAIIDWGGLKPSYLGPQ